MGIPLEDHRRILNYTPICRCNFDYVAITVLRFNEYFIIDSGNSIMNFYVCAIIQSMKTKDGDKIFYIRLFQNLMICSLKKCLNVGDELC